MEKSRTDLKSYFKKNSIPTQMNFEDLIDSMLNQYDDGITKTAGNPLRIAVDGDANPEKAAVNFYDKIDDATPTWTVRLNPRRDTNDPASTKPGFSVGDGGGSSRLFIDQENGNVGIGTTDPRTALDTGTGVISGAANDYINAQFTLSGGGRVTWEGPGGRLKWDNRFIAISMERGGSFADGHVNITQPTTNIPAANVYDNQARSATAEGVTLNEWEALYAVHPVGGGADSVSRFEIRRYTDDFFAPGNWILVAVVNGDDDTVKLGTGAIVSARSAVSSGSSLPTGVIVMWSGTADQIPGGWALCDGAKGTPDLRDRFVVGAGATYAVDRTGGATEVRLTTEQMPSHSHTVKDPGHSHSVTGAIKHRQSFNGASGVDHPLKHNKQDDRDSAYSLKAESSLSNIKVNSTGGGQPHDNMPPYYALCFIMKL